MPTPNGHELARLLERQCFRLARDREAHAPSADDADARRVVTDLADCEARLTELAETVRGASEPWKLTGLVAYELNRAAGIATAALRHTPPLAGMPSALHPAQKPEGAPTQHIMDYARSGARLSYIADAPYLVGTDHPLFAEVAEHARRTIHGAEAGRALLFSSAMAAMATAIDFMAQTARSAQRRILVGRHGWLEVQAYALEQHPDVVAPFDETDAAAVTRALADDSVLGVVVEPLPNHPTLPAAALDACYATGRIVLVDAAHTPELVPREVAGVTTLSVVSGVKFLQAGLDLSKSGLLTFRGDADDAFTRILELRERSGRVPSFAEAWLACLDDRASFTSRLARYDHNMRIWASMLAARLARTALDIRSVAGGRFIYIAHRDGESMLNVDQWLCREAAARDLPGVSACTFGLNVPHANTIVDAHGTTYLRVSPGSIDTPTAEAVLDLWTRLLEERFTTS